MPGMAASPKIFERIQLPEPFELHLLDWILPHKEETLSEYAARIARDIRHQRPVLVGVSFGAIIMQEIAQHIDYHSIFVISSVKNRHELPANMLLARYTKLHKLLPITLIDTMEYWKEFSFFENLTRRIEFYERYIGMRSPYYLEWSIDKIVNWQQGAALPRTVHIHGDHDMVFPIKNIKEAIVIRNGTHIMILNRYKWFNEHLPKLILGISPTDED